MIQWTEKQNKQYKYFLYFALTYYIVCPIVYFIVPNVIDKGESRASGEIDMMFYILMIIAIVEPIVYPLIEKFQISTYKKNPDKMSSGGGTQSFGFLSDNAPQPGSPMALYFTLSLIKATLVVACYIYGLTVFFMSNDVSYIYYFYPIGVIWTFIYFPRKSQFEKFMEKIESCGPTN